MKKAIKPRKLVVKATMPKPRIMRAWAILMDGKPFVSSRSRYWIFKENALARESCGGLPVVRVHITVPARRRGK